MSALMVSPPEGRAPIWRDQAIWTKSSDFVAVSIAAALPWSTSLVGILGFIFLVTVAPTINLKLFLSALRRPICAFPIALVLFACIGTLWSDATWAERGHGLNPLVKFLMLPVLFYHFEHSTRGMEVFFAFLISCTLLTVMSWLVMFDPSLSITRDGVERGIFVKNYIDQSQEFALCAVALIHPIVTLLQQRKRLQAGILIAVSASFLINMAFVIVSRTAIVTIPVMLAVFALIHLKLRSSLIIFGAVILFASVAWIASPQLRQTTNTFVSDYRLYKEENLPTSIGLRLEFWFKSLRFFRDAPFIGHGTGATRGLFEQATSGSGNVASGQVIGNPHNQTLNVAVQWGMVGVALLYATWLFHLLLFRGEGLVSWIGLLLVVQNMSTSLFNSHLFDFHEGWMYVLGVGVAGGMVLRLNAHPQVPVSVPLVNR